jgi:hypothetical protein
MGVVVTKGERGAGVFEPGVWTVLRAGDKAVQLSVGSRRMQFWSDQDFKWKGNLWE